MRTLRRIRRGLAAALLALYVAGCHHYVTPTGLAPQEYVATKRPKQVRLTLGDSSGAVELREPWVRNDSIGGKHRECERQTDTLVPPRCKTVAWSRPLADVQSIEIQKANAPATIITAVGVTAAAVGGVALAWLAGGAGDFGLRF